MVRVGSGPLAAGSAAFAFGFVVYAWLSPDAGTTNLALRAESRAETRAYAVNTSTAVAESFEKDARSQTISARASFTDRFAFDLPDAAPQASRVSVTFNNRFSGEEAESGGPVRSFVTTPRTTLARAPKAGTKPRAAARSVAAEAAPKRSPKAGFQLASAAPETSLALGYAPEESATSSGMTNLNGIATKDSDSRADVDTSKTAIYDITSHTVYLPNGRRLEAHSGLGRHMDDPRSVAIRNTGVTPPNVYDLKMRESRFHGVRALRLIPKDDSKMYGRSGILAHTYMLGPNGQSNGCVSFNDYAAFLEAYQRGEVTRLVVVEHLADVPSPKTAADWFANKLQDIFRRS